MRSEQKTFRELKYSLIKSINKLEEDQFHKIIIKIKKVLGTNPKVVNSLSKLVRLNKENTIKLNPRKTIKIGGGRELSKEKQDEALRDMIVIGIFLTIYLGIQIYNYLTRFKLAKFDNVNKIFKKKRSKRLTTPPAKPPVYRTNLRRRNSKPFSI